jgi:hypothetical protein
VRQRVKLQQRQPQAQQQDSEDEDAQSLLQRKKTRANNTTQRAGIGLAESVGKEAQYPKPSR